MSVEGWTQQLGARLADDVKQAAARWDADRGTARLWQKDASIWTGTDEGQWLGWLDSPSAKAADVQALGEFASRVRDDGFTDVLLLGMGGSSLCPEVLAETFGPAAGWPQLHVLDSTDPAQVRAVVSRADLARTLVIVASKSGSTLEPNIFYAYVHERLVAAVGHEHAGRHLVAITDPGSKLQRVAGEAGFRQVFRGEPSIGGRYSALSPFGLVPASLLGLDLDRWLSSARAMAESCGPDRPAATNPGVGPGVVLGTAAVTGRDKLTFVVSPRIGSLGAWLEQLVAESTGKRGKAIIPVDREPLGPPECYGADRLFAYVRLSAAPDPDQDAGIEALAAAGHPVLRVNVAEPLDLAGEFFRWEIATAVAGAIMGINPFDQPDVEASKVATRALTSDFEVRGVLPSETPVIEGQGLRLFTDEANAATIAAAADASTSAAWIAAHLDRLTAGDYFALLAYVPMTPAHEAILRQIRTRVRDRRRVATCVGFGPRFLHSTGQAYKGGPSSGVFLQITCEDAEDLPVPGARYSFGVVKAAQARGDFQVLLDRGRRALRVHLGPDVRAGLATLDQLVAAAVA